MFFSTNSRRFAFLPLAVVIAALLAAPSARSAPAGDAIAPLDLKKPDAPVRIVGGDWTWEFEKGVVRGKGAGEITVTWGEGVFAKAARVELSRPPLEIIMTAGVSASFEGSTLTCDELSYSESGMKAIAAGNVKTAFARPAIVVRSERAELSGVGAMRGGELVAFSGNVTVEAPHEGRLACDAVTYAPETRSLVIPGAFSGSLPLFFIKDEKNPFYGQTAEIAGERIEALLSDEGLLTDAAIAGASIKTGAAYLYSPSVEIDVTGGYSEAILRSDAAEAVSGYFVSSDGNRADFTCDRIVITEKDGRAKLSGNVKVDGEGFHVLSEYAFLTRDGGTWRITASGGVSLNADDLYFQQPQAQE